METLKLSTNLIGKAGFYCSYHGYGKSDFVLNEDMIQQDFEDGYTEITPDYYWKHFDNSSYMDDLAHAVFEHLEEVFNDFFPFEFTFQGQGYTSPREYNFRTDVFNFDLKLNWESFFNWIIEQVNEDSESFTRFLKDNFTSCDGFISHTANNPDEWLRDFEAMEQTAIGAALAYLLPVFEASDFLEYCSDMSYSEYVSYEELEDFKDDLDNSPYLIDWDGLEDWQEKIVSNNGIGKEAIKPLAKQFYSLPIDDAIKEILKAVNCEEAKPYIKAIVLEEWRQIDSNTLSLF